jgi:hypothetical protein
MTDSAAERDVARWNAEVSVGAPVVYRKRDGCIIETHTRSKAVAIGGGHIAVVWLKNIGGPVVLGHVERNRPPLPEAGTLPL